MNLVKDDSYISSKEEGVDRLKELVCAYRNNKGMIEWDYEKSDAENHAVVMDAAGEAKKEKQHDEQKSGTSSASSTSLLLCLFIYLFLLRKVSLVEANLKPRKSANFLVQYIVLLARYLCLFLFPFPFLFFSFFLICFFL